MTRFTFHTVDGAPAGSRPLLEAATRSLGFMPSLYAGLAESPTALKAYLDAAATFGAGTLSATEQQIVYLAVSVENGCEFCVAAHSFIARRIVKVADEVVDALRAKRPLTDPKLGALADFTRQVVRERGWVPTHAVDAVLTHGYTRAQVLEVVVGVAAKTLSNYANHLLGTPVDAQFASESWSRH